MSMPNPSVASTEASKTQATPRPQVRLRPEDFVRRPVTGQLKDAAKQWKDSFFVSGVQEARK